MKSLVHELQILAKSESTDLAELFRTAKMVAVKLRLPEMQSWLDMEMNGYKDQDVPDYRMISTTLKAKNPYNGLLIPVVLGGKAGDHFSKMPCLQSVGELLHLLKISNGEPLTVNVTPQEMEFLVNAIDDIRHVHPVRVISNNEIAAIVDAIRNKVLDWSLELEQRGIVGEGMTFSKEEQRMAAASTSLIINNYAPVSNQIGQSTESTVTQHISNRGVSAGDLMSLMQFLRQGNVSEQDIAALIEAIKAEPKPKSDGSIGVMVGAWMGGMMGKLATKTWNFAADKAWSYLLGGINAYYHLGTGDVNFQSPQD